jgi:chorismate mutase
MMTCKAMTDEKRPDEPALEDWRAEIDRLDTQLLELLVKRQQIVRAIGDYKRVRGLPPLDPERWRCVLEANMTKARDLGLCPKFVHDLYHLIHNYSLQLESENGEEVQ